MAILVFLQVPETCVFQMSWQALGKLVGWFRDLENMEAEKECIGKSVNLRRRIREFLKDIATKGLAEKYHSEGWNFRKYFRDNPNPKAIKPEIENMEVFWKAMNSEDEADKLETELIQDYVLMFQDKPPLNISIKRKRKR